VGRLTNFLACKKKKKKTGCRVLVAEATTAPYPHDSFCSTQTMAEARSRKQYAGLHSGLQPQGPKKKSAGGLPRVGACRMAPLLLCCCCMATSNPRAHWHYGLFGLSKKSSPFFLLSCPRSFGVRLRRILRPAQRCFRVGGGGGCVAVLLALALHLL
jgi:hypothetical protein